MSGGGAAAMAGGGGSSGTVYGGGGTAHSFKPKPKFDGSQKIFIHALVLMNQTLERVNSAIGTPITYYDYSLRKDVEGVPNTIKTDARKTITNVINTPQNNTLEKVGDWQRHIDEYHMCEDKLAVLDYLDPSWNIEMKKGDNDYSNFRFQRALNFGFGTETKFYALTNAVDVKYHNRPITQAKLPEGFSVEKYNKHYTFFCNHWTPMKMKYVLDNFYNYERTIAIIELFTDIARQKWYNEKMRDGVIIRRMPLFQYSQLMDICEENFFVKKDIMSKLSEKQKTYFGTCLSYTVTTICEPYQEEYGPDGTKLCDYLKKISVSAKSVDAKEGEDKISPVEAAPVTDTSLIPYSGGASDDVAFDLSSVEADGNSEEGEVYSPIQDWYTCDSEDEIAKLDAQTYPSYFG